MTIPLKDYSNAVHAQSTAIDNFAYHLTAKSSIDASDHNGPVLMLFGARQSLNFGDISDVHLYRPETPVRSWV